MTLQKVEEVAVPADAPWKNDVLERKAVAERLTPLIQSLNQAFVLSITSPWGTGKTSFLRMWQKELENNGQPCMYYNAWANDMSEMPLISFIGEFQTFLEERAKCDTNTQKTDCKELIANFKAKSGKVLSILAPIALRIATRGAITSISDITGDISSDSRNDIVEHVSQAFQKQIEDHNASKLSINGFKQCLIETVEEIQQDNESNKLIIFIDELDRCRPDFAVKLLESIKHLFSVKNIVFILAVDKTQLENSIHALYGPKIDAQGYLRRFIDLEYELPSPSIVAYCSFLIQKFQIDEECNKRQSLKDHRAEFELLFPKLAEKLKMGLRDLEQAFCRINAIIRTTDMSTKIDLRILSILIAIRSKNKELYEKITDKQSNGDEILGLVRSISTDNSQIYFIQYLEALLKKALLTPTELEDYISTQQFTTTSSEDENDKARAQRILNLINDQTLSSATLTKHLQMITLSQSFKNPLTAPAPR